MSKSPQEKLAILLPHWAEHTQAHMDEMRQWQNVAVAAGPGAARHFAAAMESLRACTDSLALVAAALPRQDR